MARPRSSSLERRQRILQTAARLFAEHGYVAASLREIAKEAECSLTLLDHHFGDKARLLDAVIKEQNVRCQERLAGLGAILSRASAFVLDDFITAWAQYEFDLFETPEGRRYLLLMLRLQADREISDDVRKTLNCSESTVVKGFQRASPDMDRTALERVWRMASSALYAAVVGVDDAPKAQRSEESDLARRRATAFLLDGLKSYCACTAKQSASLLATGSGGSPAALVEAS
ncbi:MAG: TetR/AcrR family transcriptional regulator [Pseudomonadota bacterium]|nr:TetR/AcrR family transcriptional regulator [Pseudomonadota bacterium]